MKPVLKDVQGQIEDRTIYEGAKQVARAIAMALVYLTNHQHSDGGWGTVEGSTIDVFPTYLGIWALCEAGLYNTDWNNRALKLFHNKRTRAGCWGVRFSQLPNIDSTVRGLLSVFRSQRLQGNFHLSKRDNEALEFIIRAQNADGSWTRDTGEQYSGAVTVYRQGDVGATLPFIDALNMVSDKERSSQMDVALTKSLNWLKSLANSDGGCGYIAGTSSDVLATAWAIRALSTYSRQEDANIIEAYAMYMERKQHKNGGWCASGKRKGDILYTYNAVHSLALAKRTLADPSLRKGVEWLLKQQQENGSWTSHPEDRGSIHFTASLILVLSRVLKADPRTAIYLEVVNALILSGFQPVKESVVPINPRLNLYASKPVLFIVGGLAGALAFSTIPRLIQLWNILTPPLQAALWFISTGVLLAIICSIIAAYIYDLLKKGKKRKESQL